MASIGRKPAGEPPELDRFLATLGAIEEREAKTWDALVVRGELLPKAWLPLAVFGFLRYGLEELRRHLEEDPARDASDAVAAIGAWGALPRSICT